MKKMKKLNKEDIEQLKNNPAGSRFAIYDSCGKMFVATVIDDGVTATHKVGGYQESYDLIVWPSLDSWYSSVEYNEVEEPKLEKVDRVAKPESEIVYPNLDAYDFEVNE